MRLFRSVSSVVRRRSASVAAIPFAFVLLMGAAQAAYCDTFTINFESLPSLPAQPNNFAGAGSMQTYSQAGVFTISGGVALGNPTFLAAFTANGSLPNLYGTTNFGDPSLSSTITLDLPTTAFQFTSVKFSVVQRTELCGEVPGQRNGAWDRTGSIVDRSASVRSQLRLHDGYSNVTSSDH